MHLTSNWKKNPKHDIIEVEIVHIDYDYETKQLERSIQKQWKYNINNWKHYNDLLLSPEI